jgi:UDP-3-O-acyl-N-acetylglucosamine deacetylase
MDRTVEAFLAYHDAKFRGYKGSIEEFEEEFFQEENHQMLRELKISLDTETTFEDVEVVQWSRREIRIPATVHFARGEVHYTILERNGFSVSSVEHLLAALEACGVDNCRIELEGGREVPVIDGSSHGWTTIITRVGVVPCKGVVGKGIIKVQKPLLVTGEHGSFISVVPSETPRITAGWDGLSRGAPALGRSWFTWDLDQDFHFHYAVAPAKTFYHSEFELDALYDSGLLQGGPTLCAIVGMGDSFHDPGEVTFPGDEPARHKVIDLAGDLALLSQEGQGGLPLGHFVAFNADHALQLKFCTALWNELVGYKNLSCKPTKVEVMPVMTPYPPKSTGKEAEDDVFSAQIRKEEEIEIEALQRVGTALETQPTVAEFEDGSNIENYTNQK